MNSKNGGMSSINLAASPNIDQTELTSQMAEMKAEMEKYKAELSSLRHELTTTQSLSTLPVQATSRRHLLKRMAAGAAGLGAMAFMVNGNALAETASDNAIEATAGPDGYGLKATGGLAPIRMVAGTGSTIPAIAGHAPGELYVNAAGSLFYSYGTGTTAAGWRQLAGASTLGGISLLASPVRMVNTFTTGGGTLAALATRNHVMTGSTVPAGARGICGNVIAFKGDGSFTNLAGGYLGIFPTGGSTGGSATLAWSNANYQPMNYFTSGLDANGSLSIVLNQENSGAGIHYVMDIVGYYI